MIRKTTIIAILILLLVVLPMTQTLDKEYFQNIGPVGTTNEMQKAHDIILDIMSRDVKTDPISNILKESMIKSLGFSEIDGKLMIKIGIDDDIYDEKVSEIKEGLYDRFPGIGFHLVSSTGVILD